MSQRGPNLVWLILAMGVMAAGCAQPPPRPEYAEVVGNLHALAHVPASAGAGAGAADGPMATALDPPQAPADLLGPQPVEAFIRRALEQNRNVQAAWHEVQALRHRIPQACALDDPMFMSSLFPVPAVAPQYTLMGYMPFMYTLTQQYPWFGTLRLRGLAAEQDVKMALARLAEAQLETIAEVKRAYIDLYAAQRSEAILQENRQRAAEIAELAHARVSAGGFLQDALRADVEVDRIDQELIAVRQSVVEARAALAQLLHVSPESDLRTEPEMASGQVPAQIDQLYRMATASRPELKERLAAVARDEADVELARKRYYPNITVGLEQWKMAQHGAVSPTAVGSDNFGAAIGFNLPIYRKKLDAGVHEAEARAVADARRYEADRDRVYREVKELFATARFKREQVDLYKNAMLPRSERALEETIAGYPPGQFDFVTLDTARREVLQIQLQLVQVEAEQGKALASLERAVGAQLAQGPAPQPAENAPAARIEPAAGAPPAPAPAPATPGPFQPAPPPAPRP